MPLPESIGTGLVTGRLVKAMIDGPDDDRNSDYAPLEGFKVVFTPSVNTVRTKSQSPAIIALLPITVNTNEEGFIVSPDGQEGVRLVATNDPNLSPTNFTYEVSVSGEDIESKSWFITVPKDSTQDLSTTYPVPENLGSEIPIWKEMIERAEAAANRAEDARDDVADGKSAYELAVQNGFSGSVFEWIDSLKGEQGIPGDQGDSGTPGTPGKPGKSAYDYAVELGFEGTVEEWLESVNGDPGKSAYDTAVDLGFEGTEQEWLDSIKGEPGKDGDPGQDGKPGDPGQDGQDGKDGVVDYGVVDDKISSALSPLEVRIAALEQAG